MKIRFGFVSNSSSASYTICIHTEKNTFIQLIKNKIICNEFFQESSEFKKIVEYNYNKLKDSINKSTNTGTLYNIFIDRTKENLENHKKLLKKWDNIRYDLSNEMYEDLFKYFDLDVSENNGITNISYTTIMHNSYNEGINYILKEIIFYILFETNIKMETKVDFNE